jgi:hypothetical protein
MAFFSWQIDIDDVPTFLGVFLEKCSGPLTVSFEVRGAPTDVIRVYLRHRSVVKYQQWRDTGAVRTRLFYCDLNHELIRELRELLCDNDSEKVFWHVKGFLDGELFFAIHDAYCGEPALLSPKLRKRVVQSIARAVKQDARLIKADLPWFDWRKHTESQKQPQSQQLTVERRDQPPRRRNRRASAN